MTDEKRPNGGLYGIVATFVVVIISLGSIFFSMLASQNDRIDMLIAAQNDRLDLLADFQRERLETFGQSVNSILAELDIKLQQEIMAEAALRDRRFSQAESDSEHRHEAQQTQINEIKGWFKPPALRNNHEPR